MIFKLENIREAARQFIAEELPNHRIIAFYGSMGAGKTTFIKALCEELGVDDVISSPTFAIVNEYEAPPFPPEGGTIAKSNEAPSGAVGGATIYHFDFYRIKRLEEVYDMGYEDYFYQPNAICLIEWPELIEDLLPDDALRVTISEAPDGSRNIETINPKP